MVDSLSVFRKSRNIAEVYRECDNIHLFINDSNTRLTIQSIRNIPHEDWIFYISIASLVIISFIRLFYDERLKQLFQLVFKENLAYQNFRYEESKTFIYNTLLDTVFYLNISLFAVSCLRFFNIKLPWNNFISLLLIAAFTFLFFNVKFIVSKIINKILGFEMLSDYYIYTFKKNFRFIGILLIPCVLAIELSTFMYKQWLFLSFGIFIILLIWISYFQLLNRSFTFIMNNKFHFFIYFCTLEFLPVLIVGKLLLTYIL